jgi:pimeloyl-ACP methyl ester carboxylesterase
VPPETIPTLLFADLSAPALALLPVPDPTDPEQLLRASLTAASILQFIWPLPDKGLKKRLYRVAAPTLLVWGAEDRLVHPAYAEDFRALIDGAEVRILDGVGHVPQLEAPEATSAVIAGFLA